MLLRLLFLVFCFVLFSEEIAVRPGAGEGQDQYIPLKAIDQQPIRQDVTLSVTGPISGQGMIAVLFRQRHSVCQIRNDSLQQSKLHPPLHRKLIVPLILSLDRKL